MEHFDDKQTAFRTSRSPEGFQFGQYFLEKRLAHGGMAEVFVGRDTERPAEANRCVVKCILPDLAGDPQFLAMFINEAQLAAQIGHPNVVNVTDFGEQDGLLYMAMEYVDGLDCWRLSKRVHPFGENHESMAAYIVSQVLSGLEHVHNLRDVNGHLLHVVHRDISPSNIYLSRNGDVKLGDFGIAHIESPRYRKIAYTPRGKFGYVAPEQIEGGLVDKRADLFAVGIVLGELIIGTKMFSGPSQLGVLLEIRDGRFSALDQNAEQISKPMLDILYKALSLNPDDRFSSAEAFRASLEAFAISGGMGRDELAHFVRRAQEIGPTRQSAAFPQPLPADGDSSESLEEVVQKAAAEGRLSLMPTNPNRPPSQQQGPRLSRMTPSVWDIIVDDGDEMEDFDVVGELEDLDEETPITQDFDPETAWQYTVELGLNQIEGPLSFARVVELIFEDHIRSETLVSLNGGPFAPAQKFPELSRHIPEYTPALNVEESRNPDKRGVLSIDAPSKVVLALTLSNETGLLVCKSGSHRKEIYFRNGNPVYASSNDTKELLGEYLLAKAIIDADQLQLALNMLPQYDGHMGDTLVALGMVSAVDLYQSIAEQIRMRLKDLLFWHEGVYEFFRNTTCRQNEPEIPIDAFEFIAETLTKHAVEADCDTIFEQLGDAVLERNTAASALIDRLPVPDVIASHLKRLIEPTSLDFLISTVSNSMEKTDFTIALYIAVESGIWDIDGPPPPWRTAKESS